MIIYRTSLQPDNRPACFPSVWRKSSCLFPKLIFYLQTSSAQHLVLPRFSTAFVTNNNNKTLVTIVCTCTDSPAFQHKCWTSVPMGHWRYLEKYRNVIYAHTHTHADADVPKHTQTRTAEEHTQTQPEIRNKHMNPRTNGYKHTHMHRAVDA